MNTSLAKKLAASTFLASALIAPAHAADYLSASLGYYDVFRQDHDAAQFGVEYRFDAWQYGIRPTVGGMFTNDSAAYAYAGFRWDVALIPNELFLVPNLAVGAYHQGDGKDLGGLIEFRDGIALEYRLPSASQVGIELIHYSNASIYKHNPGVEVLQATYSIPLNNLR